MGYTFMPRSFKDCLGLVVILGIPVMVGLAGATEITLPELAVGAFIAGWTLTLQYYFRKAEPKP